MAAGHVVCDSAKLHDNRPSIQETWAQGLCGQKRTNDEDVTRTKEAVEDEQSLRTWIRREFHCFRWKLPENRRSSPQCLQQLIDLHKRSFNLPGVLIYAPGAISPAPTFG
jgi:hypothetical protein